MEYLVLYLAVIDVMILVNVAKMSRAYAAATRNAFVSIFAASLLLTAIVAVVRSTDSLFEKLFLLVCSFLAVIPFAYFILYRCLKKNGSVAFAVATAVAASVGVVLIGCEIFIPVHEFHPVYVSAAKG